MIGESLFYLVYQRINLVNSLPVPADFFVINEFQCLDGYLLFGHNLKQIFVVVELADKPHGLIDHLGILEELVGESLALVEFLNPVSLPVAFNVLGRQTLLRADLKDLIFHLEICG